MELIQGKNCGNLNYDNAEGSGCIMKVQPVGFPDGYKEHRGTLG